MAGGWLAVLGIIISTLLIATGWGRSLLPRWAQHSSVVLVMGSSLLFLITIKIPLVWTHAQLNVGIALITLFFTYSGIITFQEPRDWLAWMGTIFVGSGILVTLFTLVPQDPAVFIIQPWQLYTAVTVLLTVLFSKNLTQSPSVAMNMVLLAHALYRMFTPLESLAVREFPDPDIADLMVTSAIGAVVIRGLVMIGYRIVVLGIRKFSNLLRGDIA